METRSEAHTEVSMKKNFWDPAKGQDLSPETRCAAYSFTNVAAEIYERVVAWSWDQRRGGKHRWKPGG